jgi:hypothetical protein
MSNMDLALPPLRRIRPRAPSLARLRSRPRRGAGDELPAALAGVIAARGAIALRRATPGDEASVARLASLLGRRAPRGAALVAEVDGVVLAALPLEGGDALGDPFQPVGDLVELLRVRAGQLVSQL